MSDAPLELRDDDFAVEPPPPGYLSRKHKDRYLPLVIVVAFVMFVAQMAVPFVVMSATPGAPSLNPLAQGVPQFGKFAFWQETLWYPTLNPFGAGRTKLAAMDLEGTAIRQPAISVDMQPEWLIGDGDKLWVISNNEVAEVYADGSTPLIMRPARFLLHASTPFLHDGQLMVFDRDEDEPFHWYVFSDGEWTDQGEIAVPAEGSVESSDVDPEAPADALTPELPGVEDPDPLTSQPTSMPPFGLTTSESTQRLAAISTPEGLLVFAASEGKIYFRRGVPLAAETLLPATWSDWEFVGTGLGTELHAALVAGEPAVVYSREQSWTVWRKSGETWAILPAADEISQRGYISDLGVVVLPDGERTLMVVEEFGGSFGSPLLELKPEGIEKIAVVGSQFSFNNPLTDASQLWQLPVQIVSNGLLIVQVLLFYWLIQTHRDQNYYKGTTAVAYASLLRRVIASVIDYIIVSGPILAAIWLLLPQQGDIVGLIKRVENDPEKFFYDILPPIGYGLGWMLGWGFVMWLTLSFGGFTPGKLLCGVRVAKTNLERPGLLRGLVRSIIWPFETFLLFSGLGAMVLIALTPHQQRLADLVGSLIVVRADSLKRARQAARA